MSEAKLYTTDELKKMSASDRAKLVNETNKHVAELTLSIRTGKNKQSHLKKAWQKQNARIQTLNTAEAASK